MNKLLCIYFGLFLWLMSACSEKEEATIENVDLKKYFYQIQDFEVPAVLVYNKDSLGHQRTIYFRIEQIENNELEVKFYDDNYKYTGVLNDRFEDDGVYLSKMSYQNEGREVEAEIILDKIFTFDRTEPRCHTEIICKYPEMIVVNINAMKLGDVVVKEFDGKKRNTIISKGEVLQELVQDEKEAVFYRFPMEIWYTEGIGVTMMKTEYENGDIIEKYSHTISIEEFERLQELVD